MPNLLFRDPETGEYYSDDQGSVLKLLDFGEISRGGYSQAKAIILENASGYTVENPTVSKVDDGDPDVFEFSRTESPFEALSQLNFSGQFADGTDIGTFYVRVKTDPNSPTIKKQPKIKASAVMVS